MGGIGSGGVRDGAGRKALEGARTQISVRIPDRLLDLIKDEAARRKVTVTQQINELLTKGMG